jgi:hypothetical protein
MTLLTLNWWEIVVDGTQIFLCSLILLVLIRNRIKYKQMLLKVPNGEGTQNFNTEFMVQAIRQQVDMAFMHILQTIDQERQTLNTCFERRELRLASRPLQTAPDRVLPRTLDAETAPLNVGETIYTDIETLADQGMGLEDISEELNVPRGEVELVLKLKRLSAESAKSKNNPSP